MKYLLKTFIQKQTKKKKKKKKKELITRCIFRKMKENNIKKNSFIRCIVLV